MKAWGPGWLRRACCFVALAASAAGGTAPLPAEPLLFLSTQLTPLPEATAMRTVILPHWGRPVSFEPFDRQVFTVRAQELTRQPGRAAVLGGLEADFLNLYRAGLLSSVQGILPLLAHRRFLPRYEGRGAFDAGGAYFIPWMQATYLMAANRQALRYLPVGADINRLTYDQLRQWAEAMYRQTGKGMLGFPVGPKGLMHRFLQGYLYPSFTGSMSQGFATADAVIMWQYLRSLSQYVAPSSLILNRMDEALLNGEVWVAWDHSARLLEAFRQRPDEFVAFPAPAGPRGRGFLTVLAGLGVPRGSSGQEAASLVEYLTRPDIQAQTMESLGFLPVVEVGRREGLSAGSQLIVQAAVRQLGSPDGILGSVPVLPGDSGRRFDLAYLNAFSQIVLRSLSLYPVLLAQENVLKEIEAADTAASSERRGH